MIQNKRAHREYLYTFLFGLLSLLFMAAHSYYNVQVVNNLVAENKVNDTLIKQIDAQQIYITRLENEMKEMIKKPIKKKKILYRACR